MCYGSVGGSHSVSGTMGTIDQVSAPTTSKHKQHHRGGSGSRNHDLFDEYGIGSNDNQSSSR